MVFRNLQYIVGWLGITTIFFLFHFWLFSPLIVNSAGGDYPIFLDYGAGMLEGQIPYKDFYENKGPIWTLLFAFLQILTPWSYLSSVILAFVVILSCLGLSYKIARIFLTKNQAWCVSLWVIILFRFVKQNSPDTEFFSIPLILLCLYVFVTWLQNPQKVKQLNFKFLLNGICFSLAFWIKYQLIGIWLAALFIVIILMFIKCINPIAGLQIIGIHLVGFTIPTLLVLLYFGINHGINDLFQTYFFSRFGIAANTSNETSITPTSSLSSIQEYSSGLPFMLYLLSLGLLLILCLLALCSKKLLSFNFKLFVLLTLFFDIFLILAVFIVRDTEPLGTRHLTPPLVLSIIGIIFIVRFLAPKISKIENPIKIFMAITLTAAIYVSGIFGTLGAQVTYILDNTSQVTVRDDLELPHYENGPLFQKTIADILNQQFPNRTFLTFDNSQALYLHHPPLIKYGYCPPNPDVCQLHYQNQRDLIIKEKINMLTLTLEADLDPSAFSIDHLKNTLLDYYSSFDIDSMLLQKYQPSFVLTQNGQNYVVYLLS
jgi:hypothetical protein